MEIFRGRAQQGGLFLSSARVWAARGDDEREWTIFHADGSRIRRGDTPLTPPPWRGAVEEGGPMANFLGGPPTNLHAAQMLQLKNPPLPNGLPQAVGDVECRDWEKCRPTAGVAHPRIWLGENTPQPKELFNREWLSALEAVSSLSSRLRELFRSVHPTPTNLDVFGYAWRELLILAATEVESSFRAILEANTFRAGGKKADRRLTTADYFELCEPMRLREWEVELVDQPDAPRIAPFANWSRAEPTQSLPWYDAYNASKHNREAHFSRATARHAVTAVCAAYAMVLAQFGDFDVRAALGLSEFRAFARPQFTSEEQYVPPLQGINESPAWKYESFPWVVVL